MKRMTIPMTPALVGIGIALLMVAAWTIFMGRVNTATTTLQVQVAGTVEQVLFYRTTDPVQPVATITTEGEDTSTSVELPKSAGNLLFVQAPPAQYYFVTKQGEESYQSSIICCETGLGRTSTNLVIRGLQDWEQTEP